VRAGVYDRFHCSPAEQVTTASATKECSGYAGVDESFAVKAIVAIMIHGRTKSDEGQIAVLAIARAAPAHRKPGFSFSEIGAEALIRLRGRRLVQRFAGCPVVPPPPPAGGTSDLTTAFRAVASSKVGAPKAEGNSHRQRKELLRPSSGGGDQRLSPSSAPLRSRSAELDLPGVPSLDFRSQPEARPATTKINDWARHIGIPVKVLAHSVAVREPKDPGDVVRVDQIVDEHAASHASSLHVTAVEAYACELPSDASCSLLV
jgi:hypothetical protein